METNTSRNQNPSTVKNLEELIFRKVLPRLPVKSLLRLKFVAHRWNDFIKSVDFLKTHVRYLPSHLNSNSTTSVLILDGRRFLQFLDFEKARIPCCSCCFNCLLSSCQCLSFLIPPCCAESDDDDYDDDGDDRDGIARKVFSRRVVGLSYHDILLSSCNGIALMVSPSDADLRCRSGFHYVLYNPLLGPHPLANIPHPNDNRLGNEAPWPFNSYGFGFGYVSSTEDYYIAAVNLPSGLNVVVSLYSLKSKTWRNDDFALTLNLGEEGRSLPLLFQKYWSRNTGTLVKETLHWGIKQGKENHFIFAYDLAAVGYKLLLYPGDFIANQDDVAEMGLCCLNDCLCAWAQDKRNAVELWMWKDPNWSQLFHIKADHRVCDFFGINKSDHYLMLSDVNPANKAGVDYKLYLSNLRGKKRLIGTQKKIWNAVNYVPSLESFQAMNSETNQ